MKNKKLLFSLLLFFFLLLLSNICMAADLDVINDYTITIDPRTDGSLDMTYHLEWKVLDSTSEGPLKWVKIGIPNSNVNSISAISKNIKSIRHYEDGGDFIRIDFDKSYYEGDVLDIDFKFHQSYMYNLTGTSCEYSFTPGWFDDINIKKLTILWKADDVKSSTSKKTNSDGYLVWTANNLLKGRKYKIEVVYPSDTFNTSVEKQSSYATTASTFSSSADNSIAVIFTLLIIVGFLSMILSIFSGGGYYRHGGYGYRRHHRPYSSHRSSCACVSSCACACACAGGGRAGCSKKDFYGTNLRTQKLNKILNG